MFEKDRIIYKLTILNTLGSKDSTFNVVILKQMIWAAD